MEKLELKHIAPYLPYGLKVKDFDSEDEQSIEGYFIRDNGINFSIQNGICHITNMKPILRPLSDLTKEIEVNGEKFIPAFRLYPFTDENTTIDEPYSDGRPVRISNEEGCFMIYSGTSFKFEDYMKGRNLKFNDYDMVNKLIKWHFDVFGLIEKGLAVDINTLNNG